MENDVNNKKEIPNVSNVKGNSYDITIDEEKYRVSIRKEPEYTYHYSGSYDPADVETTTYQPFYLEATSENNISIAISFRFSDNYFDYPPQCELLSYSINGQEMPLSPTLQEEKGIPAIEAKDFYNKAFGEPFSIKSIPTFKERTLNGKHFAGPALHNIFFAGDISLEEVVDNYFKADKIYAQEEQKCAAQIPAYQEGFSLVAKENAKLAAENAQLQAQQEAIAAQIALNTEKMNSNLSTYNQNFPIEVIYMAKKLGKERT
ncbi:MAG: hypothetical protein IKD08_04830 [Alphaproteobacteria bacterium]|nr:hypothetical protein [Alphaproteobacteria bacterium]